jgi:hypothetical protein
LIAGEVAVHGDGSKLLVAGEIGELFFHRFQQVIHGRTAEVLEMQLPLELGAPGFKFFDLGFVRRRFI